MIRRVTEQANARDHHVRSTVDQMRHPGSYGQLRYNGQGPHRIGTTLSVVSMQKSVHLSKVVAILAAERASSYLRLDDTVTVITSSDTVMVR